MSILKSKKIINQISSHDKSLIEVKGELLKKLQNIEIEMLKDINDICVKNNIPIVLGGGTCLGAVRHKGFIPWDDDIDLNIQRKYVDKFIDLISKNYDEEYLIRYRNNHQIRPFIKIEKRGTLFEEIDYNVENIGITIDIFIIENVPNNFIMRNIFGIICTFKLFIASCLSFYENRNRKFIEIMKNNTRSKINYYIKYSIGFVFSKNSYNTIIRENDMYFSKYKNSGSSFVCIPTGRNHYFGEIYRKEMFEYLENVKFEGVECKIPNNYDVYLRKLYGNNYMQIPPESRREHHKVLRIKI